MPDYKEMLENYRKRAEAALEERMDACQSPEPLREAMRYSLLGGGKRLRAALVMAGCEMMGGKAEDTLPWACAIEMIHAYSLIHDDLPAMDDDDLRRGRPTNHKVYGEGMAILAGDGLLSLAFEEMLSHTETPQQILACRCIAKAAGAVGMVAGQCKDLDCERKRCGGAEELRYIHEHKTADMLIGAVTAGMALAGAGEEDLALGREFGLGLGLAFQIWDDLLDVEGDVAILGKQTGMDAARGKLTWVTLHGVEKAHQAAREWTDRAVNALEKYGDRAAFLRETALRQIGRKA